MSPWSVQISALIKLPPPQPEVREFRKRGSQKDAHQLEHLRAMSVARGEVTRKKILALLPATTLEIATALGMSKTNIRDHLRLMVADGRTVKSKKGCVWERVNEQPTH